MYGYKDVYFNKKHQGFRNSIWIELIGFDNTLADYGVGDFLSKTGFKPDMLSWHLTSIAFVMMHEGMEKEYPFPAYVCSYCGHDGNDDRSRQQWTNYQFKGLIDELHKHGIESYISMFDFDSPTELEGVERYTSAHPELMVVDRTGRRTDIIHVLKKFPDGTPFEQVFIQKLKQVIKDFNLDGIQIADGVSSPRIAIQKADFTDEMTKPFYEKYNIPSLDVNGLTFEQKIVRTAEYIYSNYRKEWIKYNTALWSEFMDHVIKAINSTGAKAGFNSAWTKGPLEAIYRYGTDYKSFEKSGADSFFVEDVSADLFFLSNYDNGYKMPHERRKFIHYEFVANLMQIKAYMPNLKLTPLCMIRDTLEQWDVLHHMPTAMQRAVAVNLNNCYIDSNGKFSPITNGPHYCLGDGLTVKEWEDLRMMWDSAFTQNITDVVGATIVWSDKKFEKEVDSFIDTRLWYNGKWTAELLAKGGAVHKITRIENLDKIKGDILVINPALLDQDEKALISAYKGGDVLRLGLDEKGEISFTNNGVNVLESQKVQPIDAKKIVASDELWTGPLEFTYIDDAFVNGVAKYINQKSNLPTITEDFGQCKVNEVKTGKNTSRIFIDNEEYWYAIPVIKLNRKIKSIKLITKPDCYPIARADEYSFAVRVPGFGMDIAEVVYFD